MKVLKEMQLMVAQAIEKGPSLKVLQRRRIGSVEYQVYPVVMLAEGVHHGVGTDPVYYPPQVLEASAPHWNNMPVTVGHPVLPDGTHVLCNHDGTIRQEWQVGYVANVVFEGGKLKAELFLNTALVSQKSPSLFSFIENGGKLEVSTGLLAMDDGQAGQWNSEQYSASIVDMIPDHLALLPNSTGACSWDDGCGLRANEKNIIDITTLSAENVKEYLYTNKGDTFFVILAKQQELGGLIDKVRRFVDSMDVYDRATERSVVANYLRAVYSDSFIYKQDLRRPNQPEQSVLLKQKYSVNDSGELEFVGDPEEVIEDLQYKPKSNEGGTAENNITEEVRIMATAAAKAKCAEKAVTPADKAKCKEMTVNQMIENQDNAFTEEDREWLTGLNEAQFSKVLANAEPKEIIKREKIVEKVIDNTKAAPTTLAGWLETVPTEIRSVVNAGMKELDTKRASLIAKITANERNTFNEDQLKGMDMGMLESISSLLPAPAPNYSGQAPAGQVVNTGHVEEAYIPVTLSQNLGKK